MKIIYKYQNPKSLHLPQL